MTAALQLSPEKLAEYKRGALARALRNRNDDSAHYERAWDFARDASKLLKEEYGARRVLAFGSLLYREEFGTLSDIDLAVEGISWPAYFRAWSAIELLTHEFGIDLIDLSIVSDRFRERVTSEGKSL